MGLRDRFSAWWQAKHEDLLMEECSACAHRYWPSEIVLDPQGYAYRGCCPRCEAEQWAVSLPEAREYRQYDDTIFGETADSSHERR